MIIYNVTVNIDENAKEEWLQWMVSQHIPNVLNTGLFTNARISRLLVEEEMGGHTFSIQYTLPSLINYELYQATYAAVLQQEHTDKFEGKFAAFRTIMKVEAELEP